MASVISKRVAGCLAALATVVLLGPARTAEGGDGAPVIIERPIRFDAERRSLTLEYLRKHYGIEAKEPKIEPRAVVIHWTATSGLEATWRSFDRVRVRTTRRHLVRGGALNVSAHFLVGRDGTIYRLLAEDVMARHCIGLNYDSIGIENLGGGPDLPLTDKQLEADAALVRDLVSRHPIRYLLGHMEWKRFENSALFRELDPTYRNAKPDPGATFMRRLRAKLRPLGLLDRP
jgi:N-acetyl-anhydromuramyl-L-alanine amidase AmpD